MCAEQGLALQRSSFAAQLSTPMLLLSCLIQHRKFLEGSKGAKCAEHSHVAASIWIVYGASPQPGRLCLLR